MEASLGSPGYPSNKYTHHHPVSHIPTRTRDLSTSGSSEESSEGSLNHPWHSDDGSSDDDVPLAQSIPTALKAQKSIRKKVKEERADKKRARDAAKDKLNGKPTHLRPLQGRSLEKAWNDTMNPPPQPQPQDQRQKYYTPQFIHPSPPPPQPVFPPMAPRLRSKSVSGAGSRPVLAQPIPPIPLARSKTHARTSSRDHSSDAKEQATLRPHRSLHHHTSATSPPSSRQRSTSVSRPHHSPKPTELIPPLPARRQSEETRRPSPSSNHTTTSPPQHQPRLAAESMIVDDKMIKALMSGKPEKIAELRRKHTLASSARLKKSGNSSTVAEFNALLPLSPPPPPPPPVPSIPQLRPSPSMDEGAGQTRIFIGDIQRYQTLNITSGMTASDLLLILESEGVFKGWVGIGQWVLFEQVLELGMERPLRPFELLSSVISGWGGNGKSGTTNSGALLAKMHDSYAVLLGNSRIPDAGPVWRGWVEWEMKRGKWYKRWLELKEHGIWVAKKDGAKPELLCSLSAFDVYTLNPSTSSTIKQKSPKPYMFALKSADSLTFFEDKSDYIHVFCCKEEDGDGWVESILLARSYILHQERHVLGSNHQHHHPQPDLNRRPTTGATRPNKRVVGDSSHSNALFEPGSLLRTAGGGA